MPPLQMLNDMLTYIRSSRCCALEYFPVQKGAVLSSVRSKIRIPVRKCRKRESENKLAVSYISPCMFGRLSLHNTTAGWPILVKSPAAQRQFPSCSTGSCEIYGTAMWDWRCPAGFLWACSVGLRTHAVLWGPSPRVLWASGVPVRLLRGTMLDHRLILIHSPLATARSGCSSSSNTLAARSYYPNVPPRPGRPQSNITRRPQIMFTTCHCTVTNM